MKPKKSNKDSLYMMWSLAIVLCVILSFFALFFASCSKGEDSGKTSGKEVPVLEDDGGDGTSGDGAGAASAAPDTQTPPESTPASVTEAPPTRLAETADAGTAYIDKFVFLGDSTTYALKANGVLSGGTNTTQVWTPASGTLTLSYQSIATIVYPETGEELTIVEAVTKKQPEYMLITLGVNGVSFMDEEYFTSEYTALVQNIQAASPNTKIILNSIYPVASNYQYLGDINNEKITAANGWVEKVAENTGVRFLNSFEAIVGADGWLPYEKSNGDGIHLNADGCNVILNYIRTHEYQ